MNDFISKLKEGIIFYGNGFISLSARCEGCYDFNYLCDGPSFGGCARGCYEYSNDNEIEHYDKISHILDLLYLSYPNNFILARVLGFSKQELAEHREKLIEKKRKANSGELAYVGGLNKYLKQLDDSFLISDNEIQKIIKNEIKLAQLIYPFLCKEMCLLDFISEKPLSENTEVVLSKVKDFLNNQLEIQEKDLYI